MTYKRNIFNIFYSGFAIFGYYLFCDSPLVFILDPLVIRDMQFKDFLQHSVHWQH